MTAPTLHPSEWTPAMWMAHTKALVSARHNAEGALGSALDVIADLTHANRALRDDIAARDADLARLLSSISPATVQAPEGSGSAAAGDSTPHPHRARLNPGTGASMTSSFDFPFGVLYGLASATNPNLAHQAATKTENAHEDEIKALTAEIAALRAQLADLPSAEDMRVLALGFHGDFSTMGYAAWDRYEAVKRSIIERWAPPKPELTANATLTEPAIPTTNEE